MKSRRSPFPNIGSAPRAWLVDLDGTLYTPTPLKMLMGVEIFLTGLRDLRTVREFRRQHELIRHHQQEPHSNPFELQLSLTATALGEDPNQVRDTVSRWMIARPGKWIALLKRKSLIAELHKFRQQGGKTALVSDYPARSKLKAMSIAGLFDVVVANGEEGCPAYLKPHPDGYLKAAKALGIAPSNCLVVGDREDADGEAAKRAGMPFRRV